MELGNSSDVVFTIQTADSLIREAKRYHAEGNLDQTIQTYEKALELDPHNSKTLTLLGHVFLEKDLRKEGLIRLDQALQINPQDHLALGGKAITLCEEGEFLKALECANAALAIKDSYITALEAKILALFHLADYSGVLQCANQILKKGLKNQLALFFKGKAYLYSNKLIDAYECFSKLNDNDHYFACYKGFALLLLGYPNEAFMFFNTIVLAQQTQSDLIFRLAQMGLAKCHAKKNDAKKSKALLDKSYKTDPLKSQSRYKLDDNEFYYLESKTFFVAKKYSAAETTLDKAMACDNVMMQRALILRAQKNHQEANLLLQQILNHNPQNQHANLLLNPVQTYVVDATTETKKDDMKASDTSNSSAQRAVMTLGVPLADESMMHETVRPSPISRTAHSPLYSVPKKKSSTNASSTESKNEVKKVVSEATENSEQGTPKSTDRSHPSSPGLNTRRTDTSPAMSPTSQSRKSSVGSQGEPLAAISTPPALQNANVKRRCVIL